MNTDQACPTISSVFHVSLKNIFHNPWAEISDFEPI